MSSLALSEEQVFADFARRFDIRDATILELGGNLAADLQGAAGLWVALDERRAALESDEHAVQARCEAIPMRSGAVDAVFSCNALQFVDVGSTLSEVRRVLRPGGVFYAHFGPIWSGIDGHQLEYVTHEGVDLVFWRDPLIPPWGHLLFDEVELRDILLAKLDPGLVETVVHHVYVSDTINRLFFEDYIEIVLKSGLEWVEVAASYELDYPLTTPEYAMDRADIESTVVEDLLYERTGRRLEVGVRDLRVVLRRAANDRSLD